MSPWGRRAHFALAVLTLGMWLFAPFQGTHIQNFSVYGGAGTLAYALFLASLGFRPPAPYGASYEELCVAAQALSGLALGFAVIGGLGERHRPAWRLVGAGASAWYLLGQEQPYGPGLGVFPGAIFAGAPLGLAVALLALARSRPGPWTDLAIRATALVFALLAFIPRPEPLWGPRVVAALCAVPLVVGRTPGDVWRRPGVPHAS